jgi:hypothetical protein
LDSVKYVEARNLLKLGISFDDEDFTLSTLGYNKTGHLGLLGLQFVKVITNCRTSCDYKLIRLIVIIREPAWTAALSRWNQRCFDSPIKNGKAFPCVRFS